MACRAGVGQFSKCVLRSVKCLHSKRGLSYLSPVICFGISCNSRAANRSFSVPKYLHKYVHNMILCISIFSLLHKASLHQIYPMQMGLHMHRAFPLPRKEVSLHSSANIHHLPDNNGNSSICPEWAISVHWQGNNPFCFKTWTLAKSQPKQVSDSQHQRRDELWNITRPGVPSPWKYSW